MYPNFADKLRPQKVKEFSYTAKNVAELKSEYSSDFQTHVLSPTRGFWEIKEYGLKYY